MYSKLLCSRCYNLSSCCTKSPVVSIIMTQQHQTYLSSQSKTQILVRKNESNVLSFIRTAMKGGPGYTKFGHGRPDIKISGISYLWYSFLFAGLGFFLFFDLENLYMDSNEPSEKLQGLRLNVGGSPKAKEIESKDNEAMVKHDENESGNDSDQQKELKKKKAKVTFRNRKIIQYENRIRRYSTPDKVFRYFATIKVFNEKLNDYEIFMTPNDFLRSITYGAIQPEGLGLDSYNKYDPKMQKLDLALAEDSVFKKLSPKGLISFSDYIFLVTMLSTPTRHFEIAFHMFDIDGNGNIDIGEFEQLNQIIRNQTTLGQRHRDTRMTGSVIKGNSTLNEYFFGSEKAELLTVKKFIDFQKRLQSECIKKEFEYCSTKTRANGEKVMSDHLFCEMILAYAGFNGTKTKIMLKRISSIYNEHSKGVTLGEYQDFFQVLRSIHDIDTALKFYAIAGASIDKGILKHVSKTVANVELTDHMVDLIFNLFDENDDGKLSQREFIQVMKKKLSSGLQQPKDTGFVKLLESVSVCTKETLF